MARAPAPFLGQCQRIIFSIFGLQQTRDERIMLRFLSQSADETRIQDSVCRTR